MLVPYGREKLILVRSSSVFGPNGTKFCVGLGNSLAQLLCIGNLVLRPLATSGLLQNQPKYWFWAQAQAEHLTSAESTQTLLVHSQDSPVKIFWRGQGSQGTHPGAMATLMQNSPKHFFGQNFQNDPSDLKLYQCTSLNLLMKKLQNQLFLRVATSKL